MTKYFGIQYGLGALAALAVASSSALSPAAAQGFFEGKTITYIVSTSPGGGYDTYGRLIAKHMEKQIPGVRIVVKNVPGAGHIIGANQIFAAKPDGLTFGTFNTGLVYAQILGRKGIRFDLRKFTWIGKAAADPRMVMVGVKTGINSWADIVAGKKTAKFASAGVGSAAYNETKMLIKSLNLKIKVIPGYSGREDELAIMRGEIDGTIGSYSSLRSFVDNGFGRFLLQIGGETLPGVLDAAKAIKDPTGKSVVALIASQAELARLTAGPPGIPAARAKILRDAYRGAFESAAFLAEAKKLKRPIDPLFGDDVRKRITAALDQSPETVALVTAILSTKPTGIKVKSELLTVSPDGKKISFKGGDGKTVKSKVSGSRTKILINGKPGKRKALKAGMQCDITYQKGENNEPSLLACG